ncbi:hypothetical protein SDC9_162853 [bioreactor metagenome]|uniref:Uncharacterized protein n=1 Tax=bioreactor metagenome TaxID=1076179 RepID=A0A645FQ78_9ZZZZ
MLQQQRAPGRLPGLLHPLQPEGCLLPVQPLPGPGMALDAAEHIQGNFHQAAVVPPGGHGVHQTGKVSARLQLLIALFQHLRKCPVHEHRRLPLVAQAKVGGQIQQMPALPQKGGAEGVDGGNARLVDPDGLTAQVGVSGLLGQPCAQSVGDSAAQLGGGGLGIGDDEELIHVAPLPDHAVQQPLHQHPCFARASRG